MKTNRKSALIAGIALIVMVVVAGFTYGYLHQSFIVEGNPEATFRNLTSNIPLFHVEILGWLFILILDVVVAWALYVFFREENKRLSLLTASLRIIFVFIFGVAIINLLAVLPVIKGNVAEAQLAAEQIMKYIESFETIWSLALIIFGFHLLSLGSLVLQSKKHSQFLGNTFDFRRNIL